MKNLKPYDVYNCNNCFCSPCATRLPICLCTNGLLTGKWELGKGNMRCIYLTEWVMRVVALFINRTTLYIK